MQYQEFKLNLIKLNNFIDDNCHRLTKKMLQKMMENSFGNLEQKTFEEDSATYVDLLIDMTINAILYNSKNNKETTYYGLWSEIIEIYELKTCFDFKGEKAKYYPLYISAAKTSDYTKKLFEPLIINFFNNIGDINEDIEALKKAIKSETKQFFCDINNVKIETYYGSFFLLESYINNIIKTLENNIIDPNITNQEKEAFQSGLDKMKSLVSEMPKTNEEDSFTVQKKNYLLLEKNI